MCVCVLFHKYPMPKRSRSPEGAETLEKTPCANPKLPVRCCIKVDSLRPKYNNLKEWLSDPKHVLVIRRGRVFIKEAAGSEPRVFTYAQSEWANPFPLKQYSLKESLQRYDAHLQKLLEDEGTRKRFLKLQDADCLGCFCEPDHPCHVDIILQKLKQMTAPE